MPVSKCSNGKYRIGSGDCIYDTEEKAMQVWKAILASGQYGKVNNTESNIRETQRRKTSEVPEQAQSKVKNL